MDSLISMIRADMGVTFLSSGVAKAYKTPDLCCIPIRPAYRTKTAMITRETATPSEPLQYFEDYFYGIAKAEVTEQEEKSKERTMTAFQARKRWSRQAS